MKGAWQLRSLTGPVELYTDIYADIYINEETGEEYTRGKRKLFECGVAQTPRPVLIETTGKFKFLLNDKTVPWTTKDCLREITVQGFLRR